MFRRTQLFILISIILSTSVFSQSENQDYEFLPSGLHFLPIKTNIQEARIGVFYFTDNSNLKVDIGNSIDLVAFYFPKINGKLTFALILGYLPQPLNFIKYAQKLS